MSIRRAVARARRPDYDTLWGSLEEQARTGGFHAWRFQAAGSQDEYIEFLEFAAGTDPRMLPAVASTLEALRVRFPDPPSPAAAEEEWFGIEP